MDRRIIFLLGLLFLIQTTWATINKKFRWHGKRKWWLRFVKQYSGNENIQENDPNMDIGPMDFR
uniref:Uncharacterized protein n=1 Tax=Ciona intestinalis TaxID=7719 RepID=F6SEN4_CIOIN